MTNTLYQHSPTELTRSTEEVLQVVIQGTAAVTGQAFFPALVQHLASALGVRHCAVTKILADGQMRTLGFFSDGQLKSNITYNPVAGPCEAVLEQNQYYCPYGVQELFPDNPVLPALEADSYVGVCLQDTEGKILGNLLVIDSNPILDRQLHESILKLFAARAGAELERQQTFLALQQLNEELEVRVERRTAALQDALHDLKQTQAQLVQSEKMSSLGQLMAGIAHEINNPISFIAGNLNHVTHYAKDLLQLVDTYQEVLPSPPPEIQQALVECDRDFVRQDLPRLLSSMKAGSDRIQELVRSFRNFSRLGEAEKKIVDLHEGLNSTLVLLSYRLKPAAERSEIQVIKHYGTLPEVECYPGSLNQVFMNILANAIDALDEHASDRQPHPRIQIRTAVVDRSVTICIADNGPGMKPEVQKRMFEPFFTTKAVGQGTGLGLAISYQIVVERHQGKMYCHSTEAEGTEVTIEIPI